MKELPLHWLKRARPALCPELCERESGYRAIEHINVDHILSGTRASECPEACGKFERVLRSLRSSLLRNVAVSSRERANASPRPARLQSWAATRMHCLVLDRDQSMI